MVSLSQNKLVAGYLFCRMRRATHAGSWYDDNPERLGNQLDAWLRNATSSSSSSSSSSLPPLAAIIGPHAG